MRPIANDLQRYAVAEPVYLTDADEHRYVALVPSSSGITVEKGEIVTDDSMLARHSESYASEELALAVQEFCSACGTWLGFDEFELEQVRSLFVITS